MANYSVELQGFEQAQAAMLKAIEAVKPQGELGDAVKDALFMAQAYAAQVTHQDTGTLSRSHLIQYDGGASGFVYPSPYNTNPKSHKPASYYAIYEENRGGGHAFYGRTVAEQGQRILQKTGLRIIRAIES